MADPEHDRTRLRRALRLAEKGRFAVEPNPIVGCVLEKDGRIVGEGWHVAYGGPHAEIQALHAAGEEARGATAYVSLEPCSKAGKTPACTEALRAAGVARVVYAAADPTMEAAGAGIVMEGPLLEGEGAPLLHHFQAALASDRPWVVLKWAMSIDGRIAYAPGRGGRISGEPAQAFVHDMRAHADAVAVGVETVLVDDPRLTCRLAQGLPHGRPQPTRVVFDSRLRTPPHARLVEGAVIVCTRAEAWRREALEARGATVLVVEAGPGGVDLGSALRALRLRGIHRLLVEGGARLHGCLLDAGLVDQVSAFVAPLLVGHADAPAPVAGRPLEGLALEQVAWRRLGDDLLLQGYVPVSG